MYIDTDTYTYTLAFHFIGAIHTHVCIQTDTFTYTHTQTYICTDMRIHIHMHRQIHIHIFIRSSCTIHGCVHAGKERAAHTWVVRTHIHKLMDTRDMAAFAFTYAYISIHLLRISATTTPPPALTHHLPTRSPPTHSNPVPVP